jgi:shikimate kinase
MKRADRPLLKADDPEAVMRRLMEQRYPVYALADIIIDSRDAQHTQMVNDVIRMLARWQGWDKTVNKDGQPAENAPA